MPSGFTIAWCVSTLVAVIFGFPPFLLSLKKMKEEGMCEAIGSIFRQWRRILTCLAIVVFIISSGIGLWGNLQLEKENMGLKAIVTWSINAATVNTEVLSRYKHSYKAMLVFRLEVKSVDYLFDLNIVKSSFIEIDGTLHKEAVSIPETFWSQLPSSTGRVHAYLIVLPKTISTNDIKRLADVKTNSGRIIAKRGVQAAMLVPIKKTETATGHKEAVPETH